MKAVELERKLTLLYGLSTTVLQTRSCIIQINGRQSQHGFTSFIFLSDFLVGVEVTIFGRDNRGEEESQHYSILIG